MRRWCLPWALLCALLVTHIPLISQASENSAQWKIVKQQLMGPSGKEFFEKNVKNFLLPPLEGTLVSSNPVGEGEAFLIALQDDITPEVKLRLKRRLQNPLPAGTPVIFEGVASEFTTEPFLVVFNVEDVNRATKPKK